MDGRTDGWMDGRTDGSKPLSCFPSRIQRKNTLQTQVDQGKGTADHLIPLGSWLSDVIQILSIDKIFLVKVKALVAIFKVLPPGYKRGLRLMYFQCLTSRVYKKTEVDVFLKSYLQGIKED